MFKSCDPKHDKTWLNYFYPMQVAAEQDLYQKGSEKIHWEVYAPACRVRWLEESELTFWENLTEYVLGRSLHRVKKETADTFLKKVQAILFGDI